MKKGFTLIELLSVIIILGIILAIAAPKILDVINSSKKNSLESSAKLLSNNIKNDFEMKNLIEQTEEQLYIIKEYEFTNESAKIEYKGKLPKEGYIKVKDNGEIAYALSDGNNYVVKHYDSNNTRINKLDDDINDIWSSINIEYVLATDNDFEWVERVGGYNIPQEPNEGYYHYKGTKEYVEVPYIINGNSITSYYFMFFATNIKGVKSTNKNITNMQTMFGNATSTTLELSNFDTSNVTNMIQMFYGNKAESLNLNSFDTSKVTNMHTMFYNTAATNINISSFNTSNLNNMAGMFASTKVSDLDLSTFNTSNVTNMSGTFQNSAATNINLSSFNTSNVLTMESMFFGSQVTNLNLSSFNTSNVTNMIGMLANSQLLELDLSTFDTANVTDMSFMFQNSLVTTGYARTQADADKFNASSNKPSGLNFIVK